MCRYKFSYIGEWHDITSKTQANLSCGRKSSKDNWTGKYERIEASFRQSSISYEQLGNKLSITSKDKWMGEYETDVWKQAFNRTTFPMTVIGYEASFQQRNISSNL